MKCPLCGQEMKYISIDKAYQCTNIDCYVYCEVENEKTPVTISLIVDNYFKAYESQQDGYILKDLLCALELAQSKGKMVEADMYRTRLELSKLSPCCFSKIVENWSGNYFDDSVYVCSSCGKKVE